MIVNNLSSSPSTTRKFSLNATSAAMTAIGAITQMKKDAGITRDLFSERVFAEKSLEKEPDDPDDDPYMPRQLRKMLRWLQLLCKGNILALGTALIHQLVSIIKKKTGKEDEASKFETMFFKGVLFLLYAKDEISDKLDDLEELIFDAKKMTADMKKEAFDLKKQAEEVYNKIK